MEKARVLVVEDEGLTALSIKAILETLGYSVPATLGTAEEAVEQTPQIEPDVVLMDVRLGGEVDGIEAGDRIAHGFRVPVIYLTAYSDEDTLARAARTEPYGYLVKPINERALCAAIETALYRARTEGKLRAAKEQQQSILNCIHDGIVVAGVRGNIDYLNPAARRLLRLDAAESLAGVSVLSLFSLEAADGSSVQLPLQRVLIDGRYASLSSVRLRTRGGGFVTVDLDVVPLRDERSAPQGLVVAFRAPEERSVAEAAG